MKNPATRHDFVARTLSCVNICFRSKTHPDSARLPALAHHSLAVLQLCAMKYDNIPVNFNVFSQKSDQRSNFTLSNISSTAVTGFEHGQAEKIGDFPGEEMVANLIEPVLCTFLAFLMGVLFHHLVSLSRSSEGSWRLPPTKQSKYLLLLLFGVVGESIHINNIANHRWHEKYDWISGAGMRASIASLYSIG